MSYGYQGYQNYKQQSVLTMTQGEMLILLYDEAIKRLNRAELALTAKEFELFEQSIDRTSDIIKYLKNTLDTKYEVSGSLSSLYNFFDYQLIRIKSGRNAALIQEIKPMITELRDTFKEADKIASIEKVHA